MAIRRRRRRKYTWLPIQGSDNSLVDGVAVDRAVIETIALDVPAGGRPIVGCTSVTFDQDQDVAFPATSTPLVSLIGNEYFIKRIVGKVFVDNQIQWGIANPDFNGLPPVVVTAAFFVARQEPSNPDVPLDFNTQPDYYNPQITEVIREPWIWRRSWILGNQGIFAGQIPTGVASETSLSLAYPLSNITYGSALDGPHIDAKTARRVRQEERLYFVATAQTYPVTAVLPANMLMVVRAGFDVRILGSLRKARNRGSL